MVEMDPVYGMDIWHEPFWDRKLDTGTLYTSKLGTYGSAGLLRQEDKLVCVTASRLLQFGCIDARIRK